MYYLKQDVLGQLLAIELTEVEFLEIKNAKKTLRCALAIEEKYEIMYSNLKELEADIATEASSFQAIVSANYTGPFCFRILLERRIANLLTSTKTYVDQVPSNVRDSFVNPSGILDQVKMYFKDAYDSSIHYRFMEMLRNHVQHNGISIHLVQHNSKQTENGINNEVLAISKKSELVQNRKNKKITLNEIPDSIDLLKYCQMYVEQLTEVHRKIRNKIKPNTSSAREVFKKTIARYEVQGGNSLGLNAFYVTGEEKVLISIFLDFDDIRMDLQRKNAV